MGFLAKFHRPHDRFAVRRRCDAIAASWHVATPTELGGPAASRSGPDGPPRQGRRGGRSRRRGFGRGVLRLLHDLRDELRAQETSRGLAAASQVEGKLTLVLTLCYLPALALLVIVPLFLTLLTGLFN